VATPQRVAANVAYSALGRGWSALLLIVTTPVIIHGVGVSGFGIYVIATVLLGYVGLLDLGLNAAVVRSVATHHADQDRLGRAVGSALTLLGLLGLLWGAVLALLAPAIVDQVLHIPSGLRADALFAVRLAALGFACNMVFVVFAAIVQGLQRMDLFATRSVAVSTAMAAGQIIAVLGGGGIRGVVGVTVGVTILSSLIFYFASRRLLPGLSFRPMVDWTAVRELLGFGTMRFLNQAAGQATFQLDAVIIGAFLPISAVTYYSVPLSVAQKFLVVEDSVAATFFPAAVELRARGEMERLHRLYTSALKLVFVAMAFLAVVAVGYAWPILNAWVGRSVADNGARIFAVLAVAYALSALLGIPALASDATGHQRWTAGFALVSAVLNVGMALVLVPRVGAIGAAYALVINAATQGAVFVWLVHRRFLKLGSFRVLRALLPAAVAASGTALYFVLATRWVQSPASLAAVVASGGIIYVGLTLALRVWDASEVGVASALVRSAFSAVRR
jgi:O-antigen/teichoic acid export membrane protein